MLHSLSLRQRGVLALLLVTAIWGTTFPSMKLLTAQLSPLHIIALRCAIASAVLLAVWGDMRRAELLWGMALGALLFVAFWLQTEGLARTSSNRNAFVTGINVLVVPILGMALGRMPHWRLWLACAMAAAGMTLLFYEDAPWSLGDTLTLMSTFFFAVYILTLEYCAQMRRTQALRASRLAAAQMLVMMFAPAALLWARNGAVGALAPLSGVGWQMWLTLLYLGVTASVLVLVLQAWGQRYVNAVQSAIIYGLEPVFAAAAAWWLLGETLQGTALAGAALIVAALCYSQWGGVPDNARP